MLTLWNRDKGGCSSEKPRQALQGSGLPEAAPQSFSWAPRTGESETDGGLGLFPKLRETAFTLTLVAEGGSGDEEAPHCGCRGCPPTSPPPAAPFPSPSPVLSAGPQGSSGLSGLSLQEQLGRRAPPQTSEGGGGLGGVRGNLGSLWQPRAPSPSRRGSGGGRRASTAGGWVRRGGGRWGRRTRWGGWGAPLTPRRRGGGCLGAGDALLPVPAGGSGAAGRRHRAHGARALLPSEVSGRGAPAGRQGLAARESSPPPRKTKETQGPGGEKFSAVLQTDPNQTSRPKHGRGGLGAGGRGRASRSVTAWSGPGSEPISPPPTTRGNSPGPRSPSPPGGCRQDPLLPFPGPPIPLRVTRPQSCTSGSGITADKTYLWGQNTRYQELFSGLEGQRVETDTPTRGARLSLGGTQVPEPKSGPRQSSGAIGEPPRIPGFPGAGASAPRPSDSFLSDSAWAGRGPPGGLLGRCARGA